MQNELLGNCQEYQEESFSEFLQRYKGFGKEIHSEIRKELPNVFNKLKFYRAVKSTGKCVGAYPFMKDSYAIYESENLEFEIQLDPESEIIIIYNFEKVFEVGTWSEDIYSESISFIKSNFIK